MKIAHVAPSVAPSYGGPTESLIAYANAALSWGDAVTIAAPRISEPEAEGLRARVAGADLRLFTAFGSGSAISSPTLWQWLWKAAEGFDVVHVHGLFNPISSFSARIASHSAKTIIRPFGTLSRYTFEHRRRRLKSIYFQSIEIPSIARASALHFTTDLEVKEADRHSVVRTRPRFVVAPSIEVGESFPSAQSDPVLGFLGRLHPIKRLDLLLDAWVHVVKRLPAARLLIAGAGPSEYQRGLRAKAKESNIGDSVDFLGFVDSAERVAFFQRIRSLILPSAHENFGFAAAEALACGLPVVLSPEVGLAEFVERHGLGLVVEADPRLLADAILLALTNNDLQTHCRRSGPRAIREEFSQEKAGSALRAMYTFVAAQR